MKKLLVVLLALLLLLGAAAIYLFATTPDKPAGVRLPLSASQRQLLGRVPASAEAFALIPTAAAVYGKLEANAITRQPVSEWASKQRLPSPWMLGGADLVIWKSGKETSYAVRLDPLRGLVVRLYLMIMRGESDARAASSTILLDAPRGATIPPAELDQILAQGAGLAPGDALIVQRSGAHGAFPPIARPAVTVARVEATTIELTSRAPREGDRPPPPAAPLQLRMPRSAMLTVGFSSPPRAIDDLNRLAGRKVSALLQDGGAIALYDVETNKLLPRPREVIVLPADDARRAVLKQFLDGLAPSNVRDAIGFKIETADTGRELLIAFDRPTIDRYLKDTFDPPRWSGATWNARIDPARALPMLEDVTGSPGLRYLTPHLFRSARDVGSWIHYLKDARSIEAASVPAGPMEELRVVISAN
jgi:hypothetical protein